jgi:hypothetical protein
LSFLVACPAEVSAVGFTKKRRTDSLTGHRPRRSAFTEGGETVKSKIPVVGSIRQLVFFRYEEATMTNSNASARVLQGLFFCAMLVASVLLAASAASAADLTVICPGGGPGAYPSITAALNAITNNAGPNSITVSGTCTENIFIRNQNDLFIHNAPGSTAVITNAASPAQITVQLFSSHLVTFNGLSIQGGNPGLFVNQGSDLQMFNSVIEKNVGTGAIVLIKSDLNLGISCDFMRYSQQWLKWPRSGRLKHRGCYVARSDSE